MTFGILVYSGFVSGLTNRNWTDSEFWQNSRSFVSLAFEVSLGRKIRARNYNLAYLPRSGSVTTNEFSKFKLWIRGLRRTYAIENMIFLWEFHPNIRCLQIFFFFWEIRRTYDWLDYNDHTYLQPYSIASIERSCG